MLVAIAATLVLLGITGCKSDRPQIVIEPVTTPEPNKTLVGRNAFTDADKLRSQGKVEEALQKYNSIREKGSAEIPEITNALSYHRIGITQYELGDKTKALETLLKGLEFCRQANLVEEEGEILTYLGFISLDKNEIAQAKEHLQSSIEVWRRKNLRINEARTFAHLAKVYIKEGRLREALERLLESQEILLTTNAPSQERKLIASDIQQLKELIKNNESTGAGNGIKNCRQPEKTTNLLSEKKEFLIVKTFSSAELKLLNDVDLPLFAGANITASFSIEGGFKDPTGTCVTVIENAILSAELVPVHRKKDGALFIVRPITIQAGEQQFTAEGIVSSKNDEYLRGTLIGPNNEEFKGLEIKLDPEEQSPTGYRVVLKRGVSAEFILEGNLWTSTLKGVNISNIIK